YELGKRGGSFPDHLKSEAVDLLLEISGVHLIRPTIPAPVIVMDGSARTMSWGFRRSFAPKVKGRAPVMRTIVNSREDKLDGRMWKKAFAESRCIIPAFSFFEWVDDHGKKVPLRFSRPGDGWLWIAGIWEDHEDHGECFSMNTTEPNDVVEPVHDRMPAVLQESQIAPYLAGELNEFGPSAVGLEFAESANFLKPTHKEDPDLPLRFGPTES
ncbi:MAG: SOS response-associated peptidase family protein, partial [Luteolibacter sp.]